MQYYNGKPRATVPPSSKRRLSPFLLLVIILPLLLIVVVGAILVTINNSFAAANTNAPTAHNGGTALANTTAMDTNMNNNATVTSSTVTSNPVSAATPTSTGNMNNTNTTNVTNTNTSNQATPMPVTNKSNTNNTNTTGTKTPGNSQQFSCIVNGMTVTKCTGTVTIKLQNGTMATCGLTQSSNLVAFNCPSDQMNNQNTTMNAQQLMCEVNGAVVDGCNGLATVALQNDSATCSLARANAMITMICPAVLNTQQSGAATPIPTPTHQHW
ncbi:MAG TPA: hypothetical protein VKR06_11845 [Ktedonosporobacter sp.]|nr:hypothetical protein [Ktedonosporobacter sp.]